MQQVYQLAAPANVTVDVTGPAAFRQSLTDGSGKKSIILFKGPKEAMDALGEGVATGELIIGNISNKPGRKKVTRFAYMSEDEKAMMEALRASGWNVSIQLLPTDGKTPLGK